MKATQDGASVSILGKQFSVACPEEERGALIAAAEYLDTQMREIQGSGKVIGLERCAIMAALNIAHELLDLRSSTGVPKNLEMKIQAMRRKLETALNEQAELEI